MEICFGSNNKNSYKNFLGYRVWCIRTYNTHSFMRVLPTHIIIYEMMVKLVKSNLLCYHVKFGKFNY